MCISMGKEKGKKHVTIIEENEDELVTREETEKEKNRENIHIENDESNCSIRGG